MHFLKTRFLGDRRRRVLVQRPEVPANVKLLVDGDWLIPEDCKWSE